MNGCMISRMCGTVIKPLPLKRHARAANMIAPPKFALPPIKRIFHNHLYAFRHYV